MEKIENEYDVIHATIVIQRAARKFLSRRRPKPKLFDVVIDFVNSPKSKPLKRRFRIWQEIILTEKSFLEALCFMIQKYKYPLLKEGIITEEESYNLFGNIEEVKDVSKALFRELNREVRHTTTGNGLAKVFMTMLPQMKVYIPYVTSFKHFTATYDHLKKRKRFAQLEKKYIEEETSGTDHLALADLLIQPVQRLPRYRMLFEQLRDLTPEDHVEYTAIREAYEAINTFCTDLNKQDTLDKNTMHPSIVCKAGDVESIRLQPTRTSSAAHLSWHPGDKKHMLSRVASMRLFKRESFDNQKNSTSSGSKLMTRLFRSPSRRKDKQTTRRISKEDLMAPIERVSRKDQHSLTRHRSKSVSASKSH